MLLAASAVAIAVVAAGAAGIAADSGTAASTAWSVKASQAKKVRFERPKLRHRVLTITGTKASDKIALRLRARKPGVLQVDVGNNGSADFSFKRNQVARIAVDARAGDDLVRIDERNGVFTNRIRTTIAGGAGNDNLLGGSGAETLLGGDGNDTLDGNGGNDRALLGAGDDTFVWDPGDGSDTIEGEAGSDTMRFNGANVGRAGRSVGEREPAPLLPHPGQHHDGHGRGRAGRLQRPRRGRSWSPSTTSAEPTSRA